MHLAIFSILILMCSFTFSEEKRKHDPLSIVEDKDFVIEMADAPPLADFNVGLGDSSNFKTIGRGGKSGGNGDSSGDSTASRPAITADEAAKNEEEKKKQKEEETKKYPTYVNYGGKDGWLTTEIDKNGNAVSANFSTNFDSSGTSGEKLSVNFTGSDGTKGNFAKDLQNQVALGKLTGTINGVPIKESGNSPQGGGGG